MKADWLLRGGFVVDGASPDSLPVRADVAVSGDRICRIGSPGENYADKVLEIEGKYVCPGFIDAHAHSEFTLLADGRAEGKIRQGVTTEINGNCGMSAAPLYGAALEQREEELKELGVRERWKGFREYFGILRKNGISLNFSTLAGHGNIRASVAGYGSGDLSMSHLKEMQEEIRKAMSEGAKGISTGLIYPPGIFSSTEEIVQLAEAAAGLGGIYTTHMRSEGDDILEAVDEVVEIASRAKIHSHISHLKTSGRDNWEKIGIVLQKIGEARNAGLQITCDRYPYTASSTDLDAVLPSWAFEGGNEKELHRLGSMRTEIASSIIERYRDDEDWESVVISSVGMDANRWMEGKNLLQISEALHQPPVETMLELLTQERLRVGAIFFVMNEDNLKRILQRPYTMIGSDSSARSFDGITAAGRPHPRGFGTFPRVLGTVVRDNVLDISEAVYRMTGLTAGTFRLAERGILREGYFADITVFDPQTVDGTADYANPFMPPEGIHHVFVNGRPVVLNQETTGERPGKVI